jgi:hypothetical protein
MDNKKTYKIAIVALIFALISLASAQVIGVAGNFTLNLFGNSDISPNATIRCGFNMSCYQSETIIFIDSNGIGLQGLSGVNGSQGPPGTNGLDGSQGPQGTQGIQGIQGPAGTNGSNGSQGAQGIQGIQGPAGTNGSNGSQGVPGINGTNGINQSDNSKLNKTGNENLINHSNLSGIQGGEPGYFYHLDRQYYGFVQSSNLDCSGITGFYYLLGISNSILNCQSVPNDNLSWQNQKLNKTGDNLTNANIILSNIPTTLNVTRSGKLIGAYSGLDLNGNSYNFYQVNRGYNDAALSATSGDYPERYGAQYILMGSATTAMFRWLSFAPNSTTATEAMRLDVSTGALTLMTGKSLVINDLAGTGNDYACLDSTGKLFRSNTAC